MPKPLFLHRPAGLYVRFRVPADLLGVVGSRFLVRPLKMVKGDHARLVAETMAVALSQSFDSLRKGEGVDLKKALEAARSAGRRDLTLGEVSLPNGVTFRNVQIDTPEDERQFRELVREATQPAPLAEASPVPVTSAPKSIDIRPQHAGMAPEPTLKRFGLPSTQVPCIHLRLRGLCVFAAPLPVKVMWHFNGR